MGILRNVLVMSAVVGCLALGAGEASAEEQICGLSGPDCWDTMGLCGRRCVDCWYDSPGAQSPGEYCDEVCLWYGGGQVWDVDYFDGWLPDGSALPWEGPALVSVECLCALECPLYL